MEAGLQARETVPGRVISRIPDPVAIVPPGMEVGAIDMLMTRMVLPAVLLVSLGVAAFADDYPWRSSQAPVRQPSSVRQSAHRTQSETGVPLRGNQEHVRQALANSEYDGGEAEQIVFRKGMNPGPSFVKPRQEYVPTERKFTPRWKRSWAGCSECIGRKAETWKEKLYFKKRAMQGNTAYLPCPPYYHPHYGYYETCWRQSPTPCDFCPMDNVTYDYGGGSDSMKPMPESGVEMPAPDKQPMEETPPAYEAPPVEETPKGTWRPTQIFNRFAKRDEQE